MWLISLAKELFHTAPSLKTQHLTVIFDLCLRNACRVNSHGYRNYIVLEKLRLQNVFLPHKNEKSGVFEISPV